MTQDELRNIIRTEIKEVMTEDGKGLEDYKLPARKRQVAALARIVKALNLDKSDLIRYFAKIKRGL